MLQLSRMILVGVSMLGLLGLVATEAQASCPGGKFDVYAHNDPTRAYGHGNDIVYDGNLGGVCSGGMGWYHPGTPTFIYQEHKEYFYDGAGKFRWQTSSAFPPVTQYSGTYTVGGRLFVSYTEPNRGTFEYWADRTVAPRRIKITNQESRAISNVEVQLEARIGGNKHFDFEHVGSFDRTFMLGAIMMAGTNVGASWDGTQWLGNFLYTESNTGSRKEVVIGKLDYRDFTATRVHIWFEINGVDHYDSHDIGNWNASSVAERGLILNTAGVSSTWNGSFYTGNFLR